MSGKSKHRGFHRIPEGSDGPTFHMAEQKMRRDLVRLCRELGLPGSSVQRAARGQHLKVFDASGRLLTSVASTPRSHEDTLMMARRDIRAGLVHTCTKGDRS